MPAMRRSRATKQPLYGVFACNLARPGGPRRPSILPIGRVELGLGGARLERATLAFDQGEARVWTAGSGGIGEPIRCALSGDRCCVLLRVPGGISDSIRAVPAWQHVGGQLSAIGFEAPRVFA